MSSKPDTRYEHIKNHPLIGEPVLTENDVVKAVATHLTSKGYRIESALSTIQHGVDIVAIHMKSKRVLRVEAKGGTSSKKGTNRFGKPFTRSQAQCHISVAFYYAAKLRQKYHGHRVAMAFPDDECHRMLIGDIKSTLDTLEIGVYFVDTSLTVHET
jgi:hypothetical protein